MKTLKVTSFLSLVAALFFILTSCQKEELPFVTSSSTTSSDQAGPLSSVFKMIYIDHVIPAGENRPDYSIEVRSNRMVIFTGRRNTAVLGQKTFQLPQDLLDAAKQLFSDYDFASIVSEKIDDAASSTSVSFKESKTTDALTITGNDDRAQKLINFTLELEQKLQVDVYAARSVNQFESTNVIHN